MLLEYEKWGTSGVWKSIPGWLGADKDNVFDLPVSDAAVEVMNYNSLYF